MSTEFSPFPLFFKCPRVRPCDCGCIHEDTLFTLQLMDGATVDAWLYFPGIKVGQNWSLFFLFWQFLGTLIINRYVVKEHAFSWARRLTATVFSFRFFFFLSNGSLKISFVEWLQIRPVLSLATLSVGKPSHWKPFEHFKQSATRQFFYQEEPDATRHFLVFESTYSNKLGVMAQ
jgi:hypothetical protein